MAKRNHGAFINARYSTDMQNPDSIEVQVEKCTEWCNKNNIPILGIYADEAVSGMKDTRPQYEAMMQDLQAGMADTVVIYDQSRTFRKLTAWFSFRETIEAMGVRVVSVTQPMIGGDLRDPMNFLTEGSQALFNQILALQTRQKVMEKMRFMARNGQHTGGVAPLGYQIIEGKLEICEDEAATVRRIFSEYAAGYSYRQIIEGLNADGITTRTGRSFGTNSLHDILRNEKYIGVLVYGKAPRKADGRRNTHGQEPEDILRIEDAVPVIVDRDTWDRVRRKMAKNQKAMAGRPATIRNYPLKGKIFCGECGSAMTHAACTLRGNRYHYYACSGRQRLHNCDLKNVRMEELEATVANVVRQVMANKGNLLRLLSIMRTERERLQGGSVLRLRQIIERQETIRRQLDNATDAVLNGFASPTLATKIRDLEYEAATLNAEMLKLKQSMDSTSIPDERLEDLLQLAMARDEVVLSIVARVDVFKDRLDIYTMLDLGPDGKPPKRDTIDTENMIIVDGLAFDALVDSFIKIDGVRSPAPRKAVPLRGYCFS